MLLRAERNFFSINENFPRPLLVSFYTVCCTTKAFNFNLYQCLVSADFQSKQA